MDNKIPPMSKTFRHLLLFEKIEGVDKLGKIVQIFGGLLWWSVIILAIIQTIW